MSTGAVESMFATMDLMRGHRNKKWQDEQARKKAGWEDEDRAHMVGERDRAVETRKELEQAAAPAEVQMVDLAGPVRDGEERPQGYQAAGQVSIEEGPAIKARDAHNDPKAVTARMSDVLMRRGNPEGAQKLRTGQMNEEVAGLKLSQAQRDEALNKYRDELQQKVPFGDWKAMAEFASNSKFDGSDGAVKYDWKLNPDGTAYEMFVKAGDLPWSPTGKTAPNTPEGFAEQMAFLQKLPIDKILAHFGQKEARAELKLDREERRKDRDDDRAMRKQMHDERMAEISARRLAGGGSGGGASGEDDTGDTVDIGAIDKLVDEYLGGKDEDGKKTMPDPQAKQLVRALASRSAEARGGDPTGAALQAIKTFNAAMERSGGDVSRAANYIAIELDIAKHPLKDGWALTDIDGKKGVIGTPPADVGLSKAPPPESAAMRELMAQEAAKRQQTSVQQQQRQAQIANLKAEADKLTTADIQAMDPRQARIALQRYGEYLPNQVKRLLEYRMLNR